MITKKDLMQWHNDTAQTENCPRFATRYKIQYRKAKIANTEVGVYTCWGKERGYQAERLFRTFLWDKQFTTWIETLDKDGMDWNICHNAAAQRWSEATIEKLLPTKWPVEFCSDTTEGVAAATRLYNKQCKIRGEEAVEKKKRILLERDKCFAQLKPLPSDWERWKINHVFLQSRYVFYKKLKERTVKGKREKIFSGYCSHCGHDFEFTSTKPGTLHLTAGKCPRCKSAITYEQIGRKKYLQDDGDAVIINRIENGIVIRHFWMRRRYFGNKGGYRRPEMTERENRRVMVSYSGQVYYYEQNYSDGWVRRNAGDINLNGFLYTANVKHTLEGSPWQYSGIAEFAKKAGTFDTKDYLELYERCPAVEYLAKLGFTNLIKEALPEMYYSCMGTMYKDRANLSRLAINIYGKTMKEVFKAIPKQDIVMLAKANANSQLIEALTKMRAAGRKITQDDLNRISIMYQKGYTDISDVTPFASVSKVKKYVDLLTVGKKSGEERKMAVRDWLDYIRMAAGAGLDMRDEFVIFPRDAEAAHDEMSAVIECRKQAIYDAEVQQREADATKRYAFSHKGLFLRVPQSAAEIVVEGKKMHHCVGSYVQKVADGKTTILFLRRASAPDEPFYTMEVIGNQMIQCRAKNNGAMTKEVEDFVRAFKRSRLGIKPDTKTA